MTCLCETAFVNELHLHDLCALPVFRASRTLSVKPPGEDVLPATSWCKVIDGYGMFTNMFFKSFRASTWPLASSG
jgi:hypothetical protein